MKFRTTGSEVEVKTWRKWSASKQLQKLIADKKQRHERAALVGRQGLCTSKGCLWKKANIQDGRNMVR